ncbi:MAG TPA: hypothetical protein VHB20_15370 [Verrucomicrobiae bacterium]|jgi:hypothetical protein|nr:hypothetical protein [Verrucomicrobiae bacterium]
MPAHDDAGEFIDSDFQATTRSGYLTPTAATTGAPPNRPPTREEIEALVSQKQIKLAELKRAQEELERERAGLEELRRRQIEFQTGREEMRQQLTRGIGLLEEAEMTARRDAEQMARTLAEFRDALSKVQQINEQAWAQENYSMELTRASTTIENARMEWNAARLKLPLLSNSAPAAPEAGGAPASGNPFAGGDFMQLCKMGFAINWPLVLLGLGIFLLLLLRR